MIRRPPFNDAAPSIREEERKQRPVFGRRLQTPERIVSFQRERLRIIAAELDLLFTNNTSSGRPFAEMSGESEAILRLGQDIGLHLTVEIDSDSQSYILCEQGGRHDAVLITTSEERLIDQIVATVSALPGEMVLRSLDAAMNVLVGRSIEEVERRLVLRTLLYFKGDRRQVAFALGLDETALRRKLRYYFHSNASTSPNPGGA